MIPVLVIQIEGWKLTPCPWTFRISFNTTLFILGVFATVAGASPNYIALTSFSALWSVGVGGEFKPAADAPTF
jgi:hypothetical protein